MPINKEGKPKHCEVLKTYLRDRSRKKHKVKRFKKKWTKNTGKLFLYDFIKKIFFVLITRTRCKNGDLLSSANFHDKKTRPLFDGWKLQKKIQRARKNIQRSSKKCLISNDLRFYINLISDDAAYNFIPLVLMSESSTSARCRWRDYLHRTF